MSDWKSMWGGRISSPEQAAGAIKNGDTVVFAMSSVFMTPTAFTKALIARAPELRNVQIDTTFNSAPALGMIGPHTLESWTTNTFFAMNPPEIGALSTHDPQVDFTPLNPHFIGTMQGAPFREEFTRRYTQADVAICVVTPPNQHGYVSFAHHLWHQRTSTRNAKIKVAEIHEGLPVIPGGDNWMHIDEFDFLIQGERLTIPSPIVAPKEQTVEPTELCGYNVADLINDGDTVMFGAGHMPGVMGNYLAHKQDLGCHTEVVVPLPLVRGGVINGSRRNFNRGKINLTGVAAIGEEDEAFLDGNPMFDLRDMGVNNDPKFIAQNDNFVAINSCLEITMWGEMGVERIGNRYFRGIGGQVEFILGALMSHHGRSIHAVLSRRLGSDGNWYSTIVPEFTKPGAASVPRHLADFVVTEYGVASLMGKTERERAKELISVAHPDHRADLKAEADKALGIGRSIFLIDGWPASSSTVDA
ncbi:acetyl-CoA hydrolase/transferase C-terminal domain-containing protein [soil metagenome]|nr:acetyl-CoA hydrolase/transferase C-terminal domain-containing protein [Microbacterium sp.]